MILVLVVALFGLSDCTGGGALGGAYTDYGDLLDNLKNVGDYGDKQYEQKIYIDIDNKSDEKKESDYNERYSVDKDKRDNQNYLNDNKKKDNEQKYEDKNDDKNYANKGDLREFYGESKFEKYDAPKEYIVSDKDDKNDRKRNNNRNYGTFRNELSEYDYVPKCDINLKDCKDGKDCYDKAKDRNEYDKCRDTYGKEDRYYEELDRFTGDRYRFYTDKDPFNYEKDCDNYSKNRDDYDKCRQYYKKCSEYDRRDYKYTYSYKEDDWKNDRDCRYDEKNLVGLGRNDRDDQLIRPCALEDWQCIRKFFARNSNCKPAYGPIPDPLYLRRNTAYFPFANITAVQTRLRITGLNSIKISEFYVNKDTKNLVIALDFIKLNETSPKVYIRYKRTAKESIVLSDFGTVEYNSGTFTAVIPKIPHLRLDLAEVHADIDDLIPRFFLGPNIVNSTDPDVITGFARFISNLPVNTQEYFLLQSQLFTAIYIQENICDFGLKLISI